MDDFRKQAARFGTELVSADVERADFTTYPFKVWTDEREYQGKSVIFALNDLRNSFAQRGIWINLVVVPIVMTVVIGLASGGGSAATGQAETQSLIRFGVSDPL